MDEVTDEPTKLSEVTCRGLPIGVPLFKIVTPEIPDEPADMGDVVYEINSTVSSPKQEAVKVTVAPSFAINSSVVNLTPLTYTSSNPTAYEVLNKI